MAKLINDSNNQTTYDNSHDSDSGRRNVSQCQQRQFFSELR